MANFEKDYTRALVNGAYNVDNPLRVDGNGRQIHLATEIETALPNKDFHVSCKGNSLKIIFKNADISAEEKTTLDQIIIDHKANT